MRRMTIARVLLIVSISAVALSAAGCRRGATAEPLPTRTPAPTFTPAPEGAQVPANPAPATVEQAAAPSPAQPAGEAASAPADDGAAAQPEAGQQDVAQPPAETPTPTSTPVAAAEVVINSNMNVRQGPGTEYGIVGSANTGERYPVTGRNDSSSWWQINYNGQAGWVFGELVSSQNTGSVAVAQNIPAPPPPTAVPPTPVPVVEAPAEPAPPAEPAQPAQGSYQFNKAILQRCDPNEGVTYVQGTTYRNGQPTNGLQVAFSYALDGPVVASVQSGPHQGYEGWNTGFYSHILSTDGAREGDWYFWIVDDNGQRISAGGHVHTDGTAGDGKCQQAIIDFDS